MVHQVIQLANTVCLIKPLSMELHSEETTLCSSHFLKCSSIAGEKQLPSQRRKKYGLHFYFELEKKISEKIWKRIDYISSGSSGLRCETWQQPGLSFVAHLECRHHTECVWWLLSNNSMEQVIFLLIWKVWINSNDKLEIEYTEDVKE